MATHEDLGVVFVQGTLVVSNRWHVLDDHGMIRVFAFLVENVVGGNHIIYHVGLGNLLGAELSLRAQILAIIVSKMVVACNGGQLDTGIDQEIDESRFHLGLTGFEVVTSYE